MRIKTTPITKTVTHKKGPEPLRLIVMRDDRREAHRRGNRLRSRAAKIGLFASKVKGMEQWRLERFDGRRNVPVVAGDIERCESYLSEALALLKM